MNIRIDNKDEIEWVPVHKLLLYAVDKSKIKVYIDKSRSTLLPSTTLAGIIQVMLGKVLNKFCSVES